MPHAHILRVLALLSITAALALPTGAHAQIRNTSHDLSYSSTNSSGIKALNASDNEICKFCHTPHNASTTRLLWNHKPTSVASYNNGGTLKTAAGTSLPSSMRPESKRCLGCHDGTVELGAVMNSGGAPTTIPMQGGAKVAGGKLNDFPYIVGGVSGDMSSQHPVGIPYAGQAGTYNNIVGSAAGPADGSPGGYFAVVKGIGCTSPTGICTNSLGLANTNGAAINLIQGASAVGLECTTCHDPHNSANGSFLRVKESTGDGLCRSCHNK